jgi:uncharacterized protein (DUF4213/DUF364 family)
MPLWEEIVVGPQTLSGSDLFDTLLTGLPVGEVADVRVGAFWTAVAVDTNGERRCGLAASLRPEVHIHGGEPDVLEAGHLVGGSAPALAAYVHSSSVMERAIGLAAINALLPRAEGQWTDGNAEEILAAFGPDKRVAMVGHFPFAERLRERVGWLWVLELNPRGDDLPADAAADILPQADVIAITGTTLLNDTFTGLVALRRQDTYVMVLGPSTPLSPVMFDFGADMVSGAAVNVGPEAIAPVLAAVSQGAAFRQLHHTGVRLVNMEKPEARD